MNIAVRYHSRSGNTKKVAEAIAKAVGAEAEDCSAPIKEKTDVLFLGGSLYAYGLDSEIKKYISNLSPNDIKSVALFGTSAISNKEAKDMAKLLSAKGIKVLSKHFHCNGSFAIMHKGHPDTDDLKNAASFAKSILMEII